MFQELQVNIDRLKEKLNRLLEEERNINVEDILQCSQELDKLINQFYKLVEERKKTSP